MKNALLELSSDELKSFLQTMDFELYKDDAQADEVARVMLEAANLHVSNGGKPKL